MHLLRVYDMGMKLVSPTFVAVLDGFQLIDAHVIQVRHGVAIFKSIY